MIQFNTHVQSDIHPRHAMLHRKYRDLSLSVNSSHSLSAATYIPSAGRSIAFKQTIAPVGSVLLCTLGGAADQEERMNEAGLCFRGYRGRYLDHTAETFWEPLPWFDFPVSPQTYATAHDKRLMRSPRFLDALIGLGAVVQQLSQQEPRDEWQLTLPPTLLAFDPDEDDLIERLMDQPNGWVQYYADTNGLTYAQAWQALDSATRVDDDIEMTGLRLIDSRLCVDDQNGTGHLPQVLIAYHDLRPTLGRRCSNPTRKLDRQELAELTEMIDDGVDPGRAAQRLRQITFEQIAEGCTDGDLLAAIQNPQGPLYASKIAKRQAWRVSP